jgi:hypothetical protein
MSRAIAVAAGPVLSGLCLVHCVGVAALAPILPGALGLMAGATWIEPSLWAVSVVACGFALRKGGAKAQAFAVWIAASAAGAIGVATENDALLRLSLGAIVLVQVATAARRWRNHRVSCAACRDCAEGSGM